jgi:hypothetical protein
MPLSLWRPHRIGWWDYRRIGKDLERTGYGLIAVLFWNILGGTEENQETSQSGWPISQPRFKPSFIFPANTTIYQLTHVSLCIIEFIGPTTSLQVSAHGAILRRYINKPYTIELCIVYGSIFCGTPNRKRPILNFNFILFKLRVGINHKNIQNTEQSML